MKTAPVPAVFLGLAVLAALAAPAGAQVVFLQNDSYGGGAVGCYTGLGDQQSVGAKFTATPSQYPYTIDRIRVFGCGGGFNPYNIFIWQDDGTGVNPGTLIFSSENSYLLQGSNVFNDILMSDEPVPPPVITSGSIRVEIYTVFEVDPIGFGTDLNGITPGRNFLWAVPPVGWTRAEDQGVAGDWIVRLGILPPSSTPQLSVLDVNLPEGDSGTTSATVTVTLSPSSASQVTVDYATADGTATAGTDYAAQSGTLTFAAGQTVRTIQVGVNGDTVDEPDETFQVMLSNPQGAGIDRDTGTGTIQDDDAAPTLSINNASVAEGATGTVSATFTVTKSGDTSQAVSVNYATVPGTAASPGDYVHTSGTLNFAASDTSRQVTVMVNGDLVAEPDESFFLNLSAPLNATIADGEGVGTIVNDDDSGLRYHAVTPCRVLDTRSTTPLVAGVERTVAVSGACGIPATARAVAANVTAVQPSDNGFVRLFPAGQAAPTTSAINYSAGRARANNGLFGLGTSGSVTAVCGPVGTTHVVVDVTGYFQ
jgi:hypothetical protein